MKILASVQEDEDRKLGQSIEKFYNTIDFKPVTEYAQNLLKLKTLNMAYSLYSKRLYYAIEIKSDDISKKVDILSAIFKECYIINFGARIVLANNHEYIKGADPQFVANLNVDLQYKSNDGGSNSISLFRAQYSQSKNEWEFFSYLD